MKKTIKLCFMLFMLFMAIPIIIQAESEKTAVIYNGTYADSDSTEALSTFAKKRGYRVGYFQQAKNLPEKLQNADLVIIGGTIDDIDPFVKSFTPPIQKALSNFIKAGGNYLGICGGAYLASSGWEEENGFFKAMGLLSVESDSYKNSEEAEVIQILWNGKKRMIYYQFGPKFIFKKSPNIKIPAYYIDKSVAGLVGKLGRGKVYLIGPHPEADASWIDKTIRKGDQWEPTNDIFEEIFNELDEN